MTARTVLIAALSSVGSFVVGRWLVEHVGLWAGIAYVLVLVAALVVTTRRRHTN